MHKDRLFLFTFIIIGTLAFSGITLSKEVSGLKGP